MNNLDTRYQALLEDILHCGVEKKDRTGTGTLSVFGRQIRHNMSDGFPLLTTKKMAWKTIVTELLWFLRGETNIKFLLDYDCHIWDGDAFKNFMSTSHGDPDLIWNKEQFINLIKTDSDFAKNLVNPTSGETEQIGFNKWERVYYKGNRDFITNAIEYMLDDDQIIESRSKEVKLRLLDPVKIKNERLKWQLINVVLPVVILIFFGVGFTLWRKRKYGINEANSKS